MEEKDKIELSEKELNEVSGGFPENEQYYRAHFAMLAPPKYPCPRCGSWNIINFDPGVLYVMRIACYDCDYVGERGDTETHWDNNPYIGVNPKSYYIPER